MRHPNELVSYPPIILFRADIERLRLWGMSHTTARGDRIGDTAVALRELLDQAEAPLPTVEVRRRATELLWNKRSMLPEHSEEIVEDVLDVVREVLRRPPG